MRFRAFDFYCVWLLIFKCFKRFNSLKNNSSYFFGTLVQVNGHQIFYEIRRFFFDLKSNFYQNSQITKIQAIRFSSLRCGYTKRRRYQKYWIFTTFRRNRIIKFVSNKICKHPHNKFHFIFTRIGNEDRFVCFMVFIYSVSLVYVLLLLSFQLNFFLSAPKTYKSKMVLLIIFEKLRHLDIWDDFSLL